MMETVLPKNEEVINAQREVVYGYYNWIAIEHPSETEILNRLEADINYVREQQIVLDAEKIISS